MTHFASLLCIDHYKTTTTSTEIYKLASNYIKFAWHNQHEENGLPAKAIALPAKALAIENASTVGDFCMKIKACTKLLIKALQFLNFNTLRHPLDMRMSNG